VVDFDAAHMATLAMFGFTEKCSSGIMRNGKYAARLDLT
jgi:hypothetical protein